MSACMRHLQETHSGAVLQREGPRPTATARARSAEIVCSPTALGRSLRLAVRELAAACFLDPGALDRRPGLFLRDALLDQHVLDVMFEF